MKIFHLTSVYPEYHSYFYRKNPEAKNLTYHKQKKIIDSDFFSLADSWSHAFKQKGVNCIDVLYNIPSLQSAWWREHRSLKTVPVDLDHIVLEQISDYSPDIIWFNDSSTFLLEKIRNKFGKQFKIIGWTGSALPSTGLLENLDLVLSCAQESVDILNNKNIKSYQLHHAFDPRILSFLRDATKVHNISFFGQIISGSGFHNLRANFLEKFVEQADIEIFSSIYDWDFKKEFKSYIKKFIFLAKNFDQVLSNKIVYPASVTSQRLSKLKSFLQSPVYGLDMYEAIKRSKIVLNVHADSSPMYASNMRLFETTGVGTCLLTDWRDNLAKIFNPDSEIVTYKNLNECLEKTRWLLENPQKAEEIGLAGQKRTLRDHSFEIRAEELLQILRKEL